MSTDKTTDIKPTDFPIGDSPIVQALINTLGKSELEFAAALVIRYHHVHGLTEWTPVSRADIATLFDEPADPIAAGWARNPFWRPDPHAFVSAGFIEGWLGGADSKGTLTARFFEHVEREHARRRAAGLWAIGGRS